MKKVIRNILMVIVFTVMVIGAFSVVVSKNENPISAEVRKSLEEGRKANEKKELPLSTTTTSSDNINNTDSEINADSDTDSEVCNGNNVTAIGDSVMLGASDALMKAIDGINIDARESRQVRSAEEIVESLKEKNQLGDKVVIALGTNGPFSKETGQELVDTIGEDRQIFWVLSYGSTLTWQDDVNDRIEALAEENSNITVIDWPSVGQEHPDWFYGDGIHLKPAGQKGYAKMIRDAVTK